MIKFNPLENSPGYVIRAQFDKRPPFIEPEYSLPCTRKPAFEAYP